jgi:hypothetical protein
VHFRDAGRTAKRAEVLVKFSLVKQLWEFSGGLFEFGGEFLIGVIFVFCQINFSESAGSQFFNQSIIFADH